MRKLLLKIAAVAVVAAAMVAGTFVGSTGSAHAGVDPWASDVCERADYYKVSESAYRNDLCNAFEMEQAQLINDVIVDYAETMNTGPGRTNLSPFPCAFSDNRFIIYVNGGGLDVGNPGVHNVWSSYGGMIICEMDSAARVVSDPINRIEAYDAQFGSGRSFEEIFNDYNKANDTNDRVHFFLNEDGQVQKESILTYDPDLVAKRYPNYSGN